MSWLLDTDVICQPAKRHGDAKVIAWLEAEQDRCYTSAVVIAQLAYWVRTKEGRQRQALQAWLTRLVDALHGRIHGFNVSVAHVWAEQERLLDKSRATYARRGQLHRRDGTTARVDDRDGQRPRLPAAGTQGLQSLQRVGVTNEHRLRHHGAGAAGTGESGERGQQMRRGWARSRTASENKLAKLLKCSDSALRQAQESTVNMISRTTWHDRLEKRLVNLRITSGHVHLGFRHSRRAFRRMHDCTF